MPRTARRPTGGLTVTTKFMTVHNDDDYGLYLGRARDYIGAHGDRRYSPITLNRIYNCSIALNDPLMQQTVGTMPLLVVADTPITYDEETEVKQGGMLGIVVCWPNDRTVIAVHARRRREGLGMALMDRLIYNIGRESVVLWAARDNRVGHHFALDLGLFPSAMNLSGAIRYDCTVGETDS